MRGAPNMGITKGNSPPWPGIQNLKPSWPGGGFPFAPSRACEALLGSCRSIMHHASIRLPGQGRLGCAGIFSDAERVRGSTCEHMCASQQGQSTSELPPRHVKHEKVVAVQGASDLLGALAEPNALRAPPRPQARRAIACTYVPYIVCHIS